MDNNKLINTKKMVLDHTALRVGFPYVLWFNHRRLYVSYKSGTALALVFNYFNSDNEYCEITLHVGDEFEIMPMTSNTESVAFKDYDDMVKNIDLASKIIDTWHKETGECVEEYEPDIKSFYIRDTRTRAINRYPLFVRNNDRLVINYDFMEKLLYDDNVLIRISFGLKGHHSCAFHTFESKDVTIHVGGTTLTGNILDENRDVITCVEIRADDWKQLKWAHVDIKNRKDVTNNET